MIQKCCKRQDFLPSCPFLPSFPSLPSFLPSFLSVAHEKTSWHIMLEGTFHFVKIESYNNTM
jgi:hypothetical protein